MVKNKKQKEITTTHDDDDEWLDGILEETNAHGSGSEKIVKPPGKKGKEKPKQKYTQTSAAPTKPHLNYSNSNLSRKTNYHTNRSSISPISSAQSRSIFESSNVSNGMSNNKNIQMGGPQSCMDNRSSASTSYNTLNDVEQQPRYPTLPISAFADSETSAIKSNELRMIQGIESDPDEQVDASVRYSRSAQSLTSKQTEKRHSHHMKAPSQQPSNVTNSNKQPTSEANKIGSESPEKRIMNDGSPTNTFQRNTLNENTTTEDRSPDTNNPVPPFTEPQGSTVFCDTPPLKHPTNLYSPTFLTHVNGSPYWCFVVRREEYEYEVTKAKELNHPAPLMYEQYPKNELLPCTLPIRYMTTDTYPPTPVWNWYPMHPVMKPDKEEEPTKDNNQIQQTIASTQPPTTKPKQSEAESTKSPQYKSTKLNENAPTFVPSSSSFASPPSSTNALYFTPSPPKHPPSFVPTQPAPLPKPTIIHTKTQPPVKITPPVKKPVKSFEPSQPTEPSSDAPQPAAPRTWASLVSSIKTPQAQTPTNVIKTGSAEPKKQEMAATPEITTKPVVVSGPAKSSIVDSLTKEYGPYAKLALCLPDRLNYKAFLQGRIREPKILDRMTAIKEMLANNMSLVGNDVEIPTNDILVHSIGFTNRSDKNECYKNTAVQALLSIPVFVRYILAAGRCPDAKAYPAHAGLFRLFGYMTGVMKKDDCLRTFEKTKNFGRQWTEAHVQKLMSFILDPTSSYDISPPPPKIPIVLEDFMPEYLDTWMKTRTAHSAQHDQEDAEEFLSHLITSLEDEVSWEPLDKKDEDDGFKTASRKGISLPHTQAQGPLSPMDYIFGIIKREHRGTCVMSAKERSIMLSPTNQHFVSYQQKIQARSDDAWNFMALLSASLQQHIEGSVKWDHRTKLERLPPVLTVMITRSVWNAELRSLRKESNGVQIPDMFVINNDYVHGSPTFDVWNCQKFSSMDIDDDVYETLTLDQLKNGHIPTIAMTTPNGVAYELVGGLLHTGDYAGSGHYLALSKRENLYKLFDDTSVEVIKRHEDKEDAYVLLFRRTDTNEVRITIEN